MIRRVQSRIPDLGERRAEWGPWLLVLFILEELAAGILMVVVSLAMLFALFFESGLSSRDLSQTPFLIIIGASSSSRCPSLYGRFANGLCGRGRVLLCLF